MTPQSNQTKRRCEAQAKQSPQKDPKKMTILAKLITNIRTLFHRSPHAQNTPPPKPSAYPLRHRLPKKQTPPSLAPLLQDHPKPKLFFNQIPLSATLAQITSNTSQRYTCHDRAYDYQHALTKANIPSTIIAINPHWSTTDLHAIVIANRLAIDPSTGKASPDLSTFGHYKMTLSHITIPPTQKAHTSPDLAKHITQNQPQQEQ